MTGLGRQALRRPDVPADDHGKPEGSRWAIPATKQIVGALLEAAANPLQLIKD